MLILRSNLKEQGVRVWIGYIWLRKGSVEDSCEHGNEHKSQGIS